jgi:CheY-like chemotaxis protein
MAKSFKILIVEDEDINYMYLETFLRDMSLNLEISHALDGQEGVDFVKQDSSYDLILMDLRMPELDGFNATKLIKEIAPKIPIVVQTAFISPEDRRLAWEAGCDDFISKPISEDTLRLILEKFILKK